MNFVFNNYLKVIKIKKSQKKNQNIKFPNKIGFQ